MISPTILSKLDSPDLIIEVGLLLGVMFLYGSIRLLKFQIENLEKELKNVYNILNEKIHDLKKSFRKK